MKDVALIIFTDHKGLVLLQQKTYDSPNFAGLWSIFGGSIEEGETPLQAACREALEELEVNDASEFQFFKEFKSSDKTRHVFMAHFVEHLPLVLHEGRGLGFFRKEEIVHLPVAEPHRVILDDYFRSNVVH